MSRIVRDLITKEELQTKIEEAARKLKTQCADCNRCPYSCLTETVENDTRGKLEFDNENMAYEKGEAYNGLDNLVNYNTLPNGLSYFGVTAGGDWEVPVFFMIYWDGKKLRGYIPKKGNPWNTQRKSAYGNDEESDIANLKKVYNIKVDDDCEEIGDSVPESDESLIVADIEARIQIK